ncbi:MARTX multifunctional-autoprocessing repeats-in-toxin holotoxin RtxA [Aeromonas dhakensis]|uniref:MARTX multifunctional-autoprocessing repeats-in-toxin holotoxin RtxA n=1 Tax=Aeromonas dhakensis TaxID=196024 RepID=UPI001CF07354|nr:MARTX multifunctional-autoprocessing repeats-in-toxin holotoxin RtxA [Aeromonas dhakensis]UCM46446.1 MARTX multifunctional-autoprocessing repeats-in-toxin holotoxin RtxA [Aeromonas dhakensis]
MGKSVWRSIEYFFTGNYTADDGNNDIDAYGFGGVIRAYGGDDTIRVGSIGATVYTGTGNDSVYGGAAYLKVVDDSGNLTVKGAAGYADISKSQSGNVHFAGASGATNIDHQGRDGDIRYQGAALANFLTRKGISGNVSFEGAGGYNKLWHQTDRGDLSYSGAGAANKLDRTWHSQYQGSQGNIHFSGAGAANIISSLVESGNITLNGAGAYNKVFRKGREGDISFNGAGGWNELSRLRNEQDEYLQTRGDIHFNGAGGYNRLLSDVAEGNIHFKGAGGYNHLSRKGSDSDSSPFAGARADEIALTTATMGGSWINQSQAVTAIKSSLQPNTYLFAFFDGMYTKINRVELSNDGASGALRYHATSWYKEGNQLDGLAGRQIDEHNGFISTQTDGAYRLSDLVFERRQRIKLEAVEADLTENSWINYGGGVNVAAADVTLSSAKMSGYAVYQDGTKVDVNAVKSRAQANTYVFAKQLGPYTKIVVVELANDRETGALKYLAKAWYKEGNHLAGLADQVISERTGFTAMGTGGYSLSEVRYQLDTVTAVSDRLQATREFSSQLLLPRQQSGGKSKGDIFFDGAGGGNVIESDVTEGNIHFNGAGAANVLIKRGQRGDLVFRGAGLANVLVHQGAQGRMDVYAAGAANVLVRSGDGEYLARLLAYGNISVQQGRGDSQVVMLGGYNTHTQLGDGQGLWLAGGGFNLLTQVGNGRLDTLSVGGANVLTKFGAGQLTAGLLGGANVLTHVTQGDEAADTRAVLLGGANVLTKKGNGKVQAILGGGANVLTQIGQGDTQALLLGAANVLTRVGDGDLSAVMLGGANVLTHVGNGDTLGVMGAAGNLFTKVGDGTAIAAMIGAGNLFTQIGQGDAWALMGGVANVFTKVGDGNALALMVAKANVFTHIGDGLTVALMLAQGNLATKVGNGMTLAAMVGNANVFTHVGAGETFAAMLGQANLFTKVGDGLTAALMIGKANVYSHIGNGTSLGLFAGELNVMTKVGNGTTLAALFGKANIVTHVGSGLTGVLALGKANIITKVGDDFLGAIAKADANVLTHVGNGTTAGVLWGKGNLLTKIGDGTTVGLLISEVGNVMTHVGAGSTIGLAKGRANLVTKVGDGLVVQGAWGDVNLLTQVGNGDRYSFAKGRANVLTKVGDGREVAVLQGEANLVTQIGNGDGYTGAWGKANVITKVGDGRQVVLAKGDANIVTQVGDGEGYQALLGKANIVTRVGDGIQVTLAKGEVNQTTTVGDGLSVTAAYGKFNNNVKVGDGTTVNLAWGDYNLNTKVGNGLNIAVMKGKGNANVQIGDGLDITAAYARHNVAIKIGNGDFYSLAIASSNTSSNKLGTLFDNIKQTLLGSAGNQAINYLVQGDEHGPIKTPQAASLGEVQGLSGFGLDEIGEVKSSLAGSLTGKVSQAGERDEQAMDKALQLDEQGLARGGENLIVNGDFEQGAHGWQHAGAGIEADFSAATYGLATDGHGARVSELSTDRNTQISQDLAGLKAGETVNLTFDFARRANISLQHGIEVLWNGERVFASEGDASSWQSKALTLTAREGANTLAFRGTGENNGLGYLLDNVVATAAGKAEIGQVSAQLAQDDNAARARGDQASADADKQRLEQEKAQQLAAIAGSQSQLEATDQQKLAENGQQQRAAIEAEARDMTAQLDTLARQFDRVRTPDAASEPSGQHWRTGFADHLLSTVQEDLDDAGSTAGTAIEDARLRHEAQHQQVDSALAKSKTGQQRSEQLQGDAEAAGQQRAAQAEQRRLDALARQGEAASRQQQGEASASQAQLAGEQAASQAGLQANQAKQNAASLKQSGDKPNRQGAQPGQPSVTAQPLPQAGELDVSAIGTVSAPDEVQPSAIDTATGLSEQEQSALDGALAAVNRLQINAGIRQPATPPVAPTSTPTPTPSLVQEEAQATATASKPVQQHEVLATAAVNLTGLHGPRTGSKAVPEFSSHFNGSSIGIENELTGLVVALPKNSAQKFGYVHDAAGNPLFMLTKDMNQGGYTNPAGISDVKGISQWQTHTIELVTYPSEMQDQQAVEARKEAMLWLAREFTQHISQTNHTRLSDLVSEDGRFTLVISNANHVIAAGNGAARDGQGQTIGMTPSGQQATVAVSAKAFGTGSSQEIRLLESAPWYHPELKELLLSNTANVQWEDAATAQNVFAYLTSIYGKTADLAREYGIHINDWDPLAEGITPNAQGLTDPKVKNAWEILPRTKPVAMLALLSAHDRKLVSEQILATLKSAYSPALAQNIYDYFKFGGEVAGHGINNATTGDGKHPEPAILFEFRQVPNELSQFVPKSESTARVEVKTLDQFDPVSRRTIVAAVNNLVEQSADFDSWYQAYRESQGLPPVKNAKKVASANHKAEWVMANHAEAWSQLTAEHQAEDANGLQALGSHKPGDQSPGAADADTAPLDKQPLNPLTRFLNDNLYGTRDERRQVGDITRQLLDHAVSQGEAEQVTLQGDAGRLSGYLHKGAERPGTSQDGKPEVVLFLHGSGSSAEEQADAVRSHYQKQGIDMLAVNLRGYGASDGGPSEQGVYQDARTMFRYLVEERGVAPGKILIHGYSMGGPIAADLARYAAEQGKPVGGLLLDRPMPSMSKAITAHELPNPGGLVGALAKAVNGRFSVEKNLDGLPKSTPIMLLTDNEGLGSEGEKLRAKLAVAGYQVSGEQTFYGHLASNRLMSQYAEQIVGGLLSRTPAALDGEDQPVRNQRVNQWQQPEVTPGSEGGETRFTSQIIIQTEDDPVAAKAAASLAGKHPDHSVVVQLDADGNYRVVYGDPAQLAGNIRWQVVGHGRDEDGQNNSRLSGYSADELAGRLHRLGDRLQQEAGVATKPSHVSLVGCSLVSDDLQAGFARRFIQALDNEGIRTQVSARSSEVAVDQGGRKHTRGEADVWARKVAANKVVLTLNDAGEPVVYNERVRGGVAEGDIDLAKVGQSEGESRARGAIADNDETFVAPEKQRQPETASSQTSSAVSYSGNVQVNVGDGEFTALNWGTTNLGVKVGTGGMKSLAFGDNNVMVHIGDGDSKHSVDIAGYRALEGAQLFVGQRNVSFNLGRSNDLIVMLEKSIPTPPLVNPFDGVARIAGALQQIAGDGAKPDWVASQWDQWTLAGANKFVADMAGLDQTSSVEYGSLTTLDSGNERSSRGLKSDLEATLNKEFNKRISGGGQGAQGPLDRAGKLRQANEKLVFNFAVAGQGADIQVTTGNWNFVFGDNIQAILDTNLGSLFGLMTQEFTASGQAKTTFTFTPTDLPRQLQNRLLGRLAGVGADTTLADIFGVDYNARGQLVARDGAAIDAPALLQEMLGVIAEFGGDQLKSLTDPAKWLDQLKAGLDLGEDALSSFARTHGLQDEAPEEAKSGTVTVQQGNEAKPAALPSATEERAFGFNALSLPNLFATLFNRDKQAEVVALAKNLKQNLTADLLNMKEQTFDFLRNSGHLQGDGDMHISLGNYNFNWGGDGKDLGAYLGDNNNFWGGRGDDVFYATGTSNIFTGGAGQDTGIMMGRENMMFGGQGDDVAVLAGRVNRAFMGEGNDQAFIFGEEGIVEGGAGQDYLVTSGNYNQIDAGADQDFTVTIGHHNQIRLGEGDDFAMVFGNHNRLLAEHGNNQVKLMGYHATIRGGDGRDRLIADQVAKFSQLDGGAGDDLLVLGGYQNQFSGGTGVDSFVFSGAVIENLVQDIGKEDFIVFNDVSWRDLWFKRSGYDLQLLVNRRADGTSEQGKFEQLGSATFSNYFADNRAQLVIGLGEQQADGERSYSALSHQAVDNLIQAMSSFAPEAGDMGLLNRLDSQANSLVQSAWGDVIQGKGRVA